MAIAAESLGLGICFIGGIRNDVEQIAEILDLPPYTMPLFGLTIGHPVANKEKRNRDYLKIWYITKIVTKNESRNFSRIR